MIVVGGASLNMNLCVEKNRFDKTSKSVYLVIFLQLIYSFYISEADSNSNSIFDKTRVLHL